MDYVIKHVRFLQEVHATDELTVFQIDGKLNPPDAFTKHLDSSTRQRYYLFMSGYPQKALELWRESKAFKTYTPATIVPIPKEPKVSVEEIYARYAQSES